MTSETISVKLGRQSYDILVGDGLIDAAAQHLSPVLKRRKVFIVTDETVAGLHLERLVAALQAGGIASHATILPPGEWNKDFAHLQQMTDSLLDAGAERSDTLLALGGGVIGDMTGFAAAILRRGMDFVQVPTTLLAQVDSSVGGKTGIDTRQGKNLIGAFHQPRLVLADTGVLDTLPRRELLAGYAEVVKYGLLGDGVFFEWLTRRGAEVIDENGRARRQAIVTCCRAKAEIVAADETETGERALLNLGHTFGHALEVAAGFDGGLLHGEAVAIGMTMAFALSAELGFCPPEEADWMRRHLDAIGLPTHPARCGLDDLSGAALVAHMAQDKKVRDGRVTFVLVHGVGEAFLTRDIEPATVEAFLDGFLHDVPDAA
ncbi:MAG: 3-dehydroquinate synthase [Proteobacteria bacterium]|nr:3-dehydroquinate synthase [Pseudomonadota bacterium]MDA0951472.1 3-dehydroquinate synthase [Pseudomonadota bacterium]